MDIFAAFAFAAHMGPRSPVSQSPSFFFQHPLWRRQFVPRCFMIPLTLVISRLRWHLAIITGFRICELKDFQAANTLAIIYRNAAQLSLCTYCWNSITKKQALHTKFCFYSMIPESSIIIQLTLKITTL